jgi:hypothetical protein
MIPIRISKLYIIKDSCAKVVCNIISKSKMISRRQGGGDEAYCTYVLEADDTPGIRQGSLPGCVANKDSALI